MKNYTYVFKDETIKDSAHNLDVAKNIALSIGSYKHADISILNSNTEEIITTAKYIPNEKPKDHDYLMTYYNGYYRLWDDELN